MLFYHFTWQRSLLLCWMSKRYPLMWLCDNDCDQTLRLILTKFCTQFFWHKISVVFVNGLNHFNCFENRFAHSSKQKTIPVSASYRWKPFRRWISVHLVVCLFRWAALCGPYHYKTGPDTISLTSTLAEQPFSHMQLNLWVSTFLPQFSFGYRYFPDSIALEPIIILFY